MTGCGAAAWLQSQATTINSMLNPSLLHSTAVNVAIIVMLAGT
jgi:hypothetical protein